MMSLRQNFIACGVVGIITLILVDSMAHFDSKLIQTARQDQSAQKNWSLFYGQNYIYIDSSLRYQTDLEQIALLLDGNVSVLSDKATSYYIASSSSAYVSNIHKHHGARYSKLWQSVIQNNGLCNLNQKENQVALRHYLRQSKSGNSDNPRLKYMVINNDTLNKNVRLDCLWQRRQALVENAENLSRLIYKGEFFDLYEFLELEN